MNETVQTPDTQAGSHSAQHAHPTIAVYWKVFAILFVVTLIEVAVSYMDIGEGLATTALSVLAIFKFVLVVMYFMHLKFDNPVLTRLFVFGLLLALAVYVATLFAMVKTW